MQSYFSLAVLLAVGLVLFTLGVFVPMWFLMAPTSQQFSPGYYEFEDAQPTPSAPALQTQQDFDAALKEIDATDFTTFDTELKANDADAAKF